MAMMLDTRYDPATLDDLAALVASARKTAGNPWQIPGVRAALVKAAQRPGTITLAKLARVALDVARDKNALTPERIAQDGPWWNPETVNSSDLLPRPNQATDCHRCGKPFEHLHHGGTGTEHDHPYVDPSMAGSADHHGHAQRIREQLAGTRPEETR